MENVENKKPRVRSVAYPSHNLAQSIDLVKKINQQFGNLTFNKREDIAEQLDMSVGNLIGKISSCVQYGILEMKSGEGYKPSELFKLINKPLDADEYRLAIYEALMNPELYSKIIPQFLGKQLPAIGGLSVLLYRSHKVAEDAADRAARILVDNLKEWNLLNEDNYLIDFLRGEEDIPEPHTETVQSVTYFPERTAQFQKPDVVDISSQMVDAPAIPVFVKNGIARVIMPKEFDADDLDTVIDILSVYKKQKSRAAT